MTICVTGGTGFVGQGVVPELLRSGFHIRALIRNENSAKKLTLTDSERATIEFVYGDPCNVNDIARALEGCSALVHLVGIRRHEIKKTGKTYGDIDVGSAIAAATAMKQTGINRIILLSAAAIGKSTYVQCKIKAETAILKAGLDWTIFRPSFITAPGQQWPIIMGPLLSLFGLFPGHFGDISR
ncbi:MAG TPA: NAD(P)-binding oxidoreductase, partial [Candidatus Kapabacteria bacterium]|nr:NAD(P)-binding oxidoreductase [Candidatus Kapabacteria bacterium]